MPVEVYPQPETVRIDGDIDAVFTWVDGVTSAPALRAMRDVERRRCSGGCRQNRYRSNDELRYSLRSLHAYAPWVRRVFW